MEMVAHTCGGVKDRSPRAPLSARRGPGGEAPRNGGRTPFRGALPEWGSTAGPKAGTPAELRVFTVVAAGPGSASRRRAPKSLGGPAAPAWAKVGASPVGGAPAVSSAARADRALAALAEPVRAALVGWRPLGWTGRSARVVPVPAAYTDTALLTVEAHLAGRRADQPFIADSSDLTHVAEVLGAQGADGTPEGMSLLHARAAWICAHMEGGTPLSALRRLAVPIAERTLALLLAQTAEELDDGEAVAQGLDA